MELYFQDEIGMNEIGESMKLNHRNFLSVFLVSKFQVVFALCAHHLYFNFYLQNIKLQVIIAKILFLSIFFSGISSSSRRGGDNFLGITIKSKKLRRGIEKLFFSLQLIESANVLGGEDLQLDKIS
eukprot:TRINITY_DN1561_c0_g2_i1.p2 TRINITY_DN1561_c0_g2~~TRINITY_DN1561_c0_g2_i1.p2  ORF type:complete len:126 (-),score=10.59 TRINITY_DN1561_c0_g2_i1:59-436(-)